jgi:hypothetical protein
MTSRWSPRASPTSLVAHCYITASSRASTTSRWSPHASPTSVSPVLLRRLHLFLQALDLYDPDEVLYVIAESELCLEKVMSSFIFVLVTVPYVPGLASLR